MEEESDHSSDHSALTPLVPGRRTMLGFVFGAALGLPLSGRAVGQESDPRRARPQSGDRFVRSAARGDGQILAASDLPEHGPPVMAYPIDTRSRVVRDDSRLNQVVLIRLNPTELAAETRARSAEGVVAYSAVCTHTGCDQWEWQPETRTIKCSCHFSTFDVKDGARVVDGPAPRRLPALPLGVVAGAVTAAGGFIGRVGFDQGG